MDRREALKLAVFAPAAATTSFTWTDREAGEAWRSAQLARREAARAGGSYEPSFFNPHEWETLRVLVDMIIPADERSGSATDAGVPEFIDFIMIDEPNRQVAVRGGLAWLDAECRRRFGANFVDCTEAQRGQVLDDIAWPARARPEFSHGVAFFNTIRDLTASGFWSSRMGVEDLQYSGNTMIAAWNGCPPAALAKLGVSYG